MTTAQRLELATETALMAGPVSGRPLRAVIYARVSSDPRQQLRSVSQQLDECTAECERRGWPVVKVFKDNDRSASRYATKNRPEYEKLITFLRLGNADVLVTWESSRAQRDLEAYVRLRKVAEENGLQWCYKGRLYDLSRTDDRFTTGLDALLDERESSVTRDRILRDMRANALKGRPHGMNVYGYRRIYDAETKAFVAQVIRDDQAQVIREAARRVAAGEAFHSIACDFNARDIPTPRGGTKWRTSVIRNMVTNARYIGKRTHHGVIVADAVWEPVLDEETFYACAQRIGSPQRRHQKDTKLKHFLSGEGRCGICDGPLRVKDLHRHGGSVPVYQCEEGGHLNIRKERLEDLVREAVCERLARPDAADLLGDDTRAEEAKAAIAKASEKRARLDEFYDAAATGELSPAALARIEARLLPEIEAAEQRAAELRVSTVLRDVIRPDIADVWPTLEIGQQREVVRALMTATLLPECPGSRTDPSLRVRIEWKHRETGAAE